MKKRYLIVSLVLMSFMFLLYGCGGSAADAPADATITINPTSTTVTDKNGSSSWHDQEFKITVKDKNGIPQNDVEIRVSYIWAVPDVYGVVQLYDGNNPVNSPYYAETDENGTHISRLRFRSGGGLEYKADLQAIAGSLSASATFEVKKE